MNNVYFTINKDLSNKADINNIYFTINKALCQIADIQVNHVYFTSNMAFYVIWMTQEIRIYKRIVKWISTL